MSSRHCAQCGVAIPGAAAARTRFCSGACRQREYRQRVATRPKPAPAPEPIPAELRSARRWVRHTASKVPLNARTGRVASSIDPRTWSSYKQAQASSYGVGPGFVLNGEAIVCLDLDHCLYDGRLLGWALPIVAACSGTYIEVSPSGTGLHIFGLGPTGRGIKIRDHRNVECYSTGRYITVTGRKYRDAPSSLADITGVLATL